MREVKVFQASSAKQTPDGATASDNKLYVARLQVDVTQTRGGRFHQCNLCLSRAFP